MAVTYTYAVRYEVEAVCRTPLRTGAVDGDPQMILQSRDGTALIQGASLAGALREWLEIGDAGMAETLFGSQKQAGRLLLSDGVFDRTAERYTRPRLRINGVTGTADTGAKFDMAQLGSGSTFRFSMTWLGLDAREEEWKAVGQMLAALHGGAIRLGAQKSNGFGRVELRAWKRVFHLTDPTDRTAWLEGRYQGEPFALPALTRVRNVTFVVTGQADSLLVKAGAPLKDGDTQYTPNLTEGGRAVLPGSSIKGAVRARVEMIARLLGLPDEKAEELFGRMSADGDDGKPGRVYFEDGRLSGEKAQRISRIRLNRLTGGVIRGGLFSEEPLACGVELRISAPNDPTACALLLYALRDLGLGFYNLGSGGSIGRGCISVREIRAITPDGGEARLLFDAERVCTAQDPDGIFQMWLDELGGKTHEM